MGAYARTMTAAEALSALISQAASQRLGGLAYAGEVSPQEAYAQLQDSGVLVDVRSLPEWQQGLPDVANLHKISWKIAPNMVLNPEFIAQFEAAGIAKDTPIFFICRSGGRSLDAAVAMTALGYQHCFNVTGGFEDWKAASLPKKEGV